MTVARRGVELQPSSALAYRALFVVLFNRKDVAAAFSAGDHALALNPYDPAIISEYGGRLILDGQVARGLQMMQRAAAKGPARPSWHHYFMFLGDYFSNNFSEAAFHADQLPSAYPFKFLAQALIASTRGDLDRAQTNYQHLVEMQPEFGNNARRWLEKFFTSKSLVDQIILDFVRAGLIKST